MFGETFTTEAAGIVGGTWVFGFLCFLTLSLPWLDVWVSLGFL